MGNPKSQSASEMLDLGPIPFKEIIHLASHLAIKNEAAQFPELLVSQQLPLRIFSCMLRPWSKNSYCPFRAAEGKNFGHFIKMPKLGLEVIYNPGSGRHDWLSLLIIPSRSSGEVYTAIQLQLGAATLRVKGPVAMLDGFMGESRNQDASVGGGRNRSFQRRSKEARGGGGLIFGKRRAGLISLPLCYNSRLVLETHHTISPVTGWGGVWGGGLG